MMSLAWNILNALNRQIFWENSYTWVAGWYLAKVPILMISLKFEHILWFFICLLVNFCLIETYDIRTGLLQVILKILLVNNWPYPINIPRRNEKLIGGGTTSIFPFIHWGFYFEVFRWFSGELLTLATFHFNRLTGKDLGLLLNGFWLLFVCVHLAGIR